MSRTKSSELPHYELLFIIPNKFTEDEANSIIKKVKEIVVKEKGNITFSEDWGKKSLAYPINQYNYGYYSLVEFELDGNNLAKIDRALRMSNEVLRHQIVKKKIKTTEQIEREKKISEKIAAKDVTKKKKEEEQEKTKDKKKLKLKDLDKKLEDILDTKDLL